VSSGAACLKADDTTSSPDSLVRNNASIRNIGVYGATVECPVTGKPNTDMLVEDAAMNFLDSSSSQEFFCRVEGMTWNGTTYNSSWKWTCSTAGGCTSSTSSFTGSNYLYWYQPFGSSSITGLVGISVYCSMPGGSYPNYSYIWGYDITY
jgi:hypothetical protein